ncbi:hypothetical protein KZJ38_01070 [Paraburkholderia edwinii]|uniref:EH signature protein n=1 Tax=Paraburkholderia edwinii TaxID=2861782 RepID=A0ABX8UL12_9BURK|nr:DUF6361 family protein [Paraburkholderia edwinii]QYD69022.1 hypothetical protein KZJ38_01070 [Paraburkholderia edwinii]
MASNLSWLDHDAAAAQRSLHILSFFDEREARDELGIGGIRDSIADQLFPRTSTIQTRLRYVFFVPWLFNQLESKSTASSAFPGAARNAEIRLLKELIENTSADEPGVIGRDAGKALKRLPSSVYWAALGSWDMRRTRVSLQQYFSLADRRHTMQRTRRKRDDNEDHDGDPASSAWDTQLVKLCPEDFPLGVNLKLTREEAEFLLDRWCKQHPDSLLTWLARDLSEGRAMTEVDYIWNHPRRHDFPREIQPLIDDARRFNVLMHGAALLYNLLLAELEPRRVDSVDLAEQYREQLNAWAANKLPACDAWDLDAFWKRVIDKGHSISGATQEFVQTWLDRALREHTQIDESQACRKLIEAREIKLKDKRSRFTNMAARSQWGGRAGLVPLGYRWPVASNFLREWHEGWSAA